MCGRFALFSSKKKILDDLFIKKENINNFSANYNISPTQKSPILLNQKGQPIIKNMTWGLVPKWSNDIKIGPKLINARIETIDKKPSFKSLLNQNRCIIISDGYYEWKKSNEVSQPYYITSREKKLLLFAGLWTNKKLNTDNFKNSFTIITKPSNGEITKIHTRIPALLNYENINAWIDYKSYDTADALRMLDKTDEKLKFYPISKNINSLKNNSIDLLKPFKIKKTIDLFS